MGKYNLQFRIYLLHFSGLTPSIQILIHASMQFLINVLSIEGKITYWQKHTYNYY
jgi:hypothetical protein